MGGTPTGNTMDNGSQLASMFMNNGGYQPQQSLADFFQPQRPTPFVTPPQAAQSTVARMGLRSPMAAPASAPAQYTEEQLRLLRNPIKDGP